MILIILIFKLIYANAELLDNNLEILKFDYYIEQKDFMKAEKELKNIKFDMVENIKKAVLFNKAGFVYFNLGEYDKALQFYFKSIEINPNNYFVYNNIGVIYFKLKNYKLAKDFYLKAYEIEKNYPKLLVNLAVVNFYLKNFKESYYYFLKAISCNRDYVRERFDKKKAIEILEKMVNDNPDDKELREILKWAKNRDRLNDIEF